MAPSINIYIPSPLKKRLEVNKDKINCSEVSRRALERELLFAEDINKNMSTTIERLKRSKEEHSQSQEHSARTVGIHWAKKIAEWPEMLALANNVNSAGTDFDRIEINGEILASFCGHEDGLEAEDFLENIESDLEFPVSAFNDDATCRSFIDGALQVFDEVKDEV